MPSGSYIAIVNNGKITDYLFLSSGSIIVNKMGNYSITEQVTTSDNEFYEFSFSGSIPTTDLVTPYPQTLKKGQLWYWGDIDQVGLNIYTIWLADQNINMTNMSGNGDLMRIEVYTPTSYTTCLPNGTYPVKINTVENQTVIDGFNNGTEDLGTWYYTADAFPITGGSMTVVKNAGSSYNLNFTFIDELGNTISGSAFSPSFCCISRNCLAVSMYELRNSCKVSSGKMALIFAFCSSSKSVYWSSCVFSRCTSLKFCTKEILAASPFKLYTSCGSFTKLFSCINKPNFSTASLYLSSLS